MVYVKVINSILIKFPFILYGFECYASVSSNVYINLLWRFILYMYVFCIINWNCPLSPHGKRTLLEYCKWSEKLTPNESNSRTQFNRSINVCKYWSWQNQLHYTTKTRKRAFQCQLFIGCSRKRQQMERTLGKREKSGVFVCRAGRNWAIVSMCASVPFINVLIEQVHVHWTLCR